MFNHSVFIYIAPIHNKSNLMTLSKLSKSYSLIILGMETQHLPHEQALGNNGVNKTAFWQADILEKNQNQ